MDSKKLSFMESVLGKQGAEALAKAVTRSPDLENALVPRTIMAWLNTVSEIGYDGSLPGTNNYVAFQKAEGGYVGAVGIGSDIISFDSDDLTGVAAHVAVSLGVDAYSFSEVKPTQLARLGKSIDVLAKARLVKNLAQVAEVEPEWKLIHDNEKEPRHFYAILSDSGQPYKAAPMQKMALLHDDPKKPKTIYRVAGTDGEGPYNSIEADASNIAYRNDRFGNQPGPYEDFEDSEWENNRDNYMYRFGFDKPEDAIKWFGSDALEDMAKLGFHLRKVPAKKAFISKSGRQVAFIPHPSYDFDKPGEPLQLKNGRYEEQGEPSQLNLKLGKKEEPLEKMALVYANMDKPRMVYRLMNNKGTGVYSGNASHLSISESFSPQYKPETPYDIGSYRPPPVNRFSFGFGPDSIRSVDFHGPEIESMPQNLFAFEHPYDAVNWFGDKQIEHFARQGYHLYEVPAKKVWRSISNRQVIFEPHETYQQNIGKHRIVKPEEYLTSQGSMPKGSPVEPERARGFVHEEPSKTPKLPKPRFLLKKEPGAEKPGPAHAPTPQGAPNKPQAPIQTQPAQPHPPTPKPKLPKVQTPPPLKPIKLPGLKINKNEVSNRCPHCAGSQFNGIYFVGCLCFRSLAKSVGVSVAPDGYNLSFGAGWDKESILTLREALGVK